MTRQECEVMREEIELALAKIADKYDMTMKIGTITYDELGFTTKIEAKHKVIGDMPIEEVEFRAYCRKFGFTPLQYKMCVEYEGVEYALVGFFPNGRKYTCKLRADDGKEIKVSTDFVHKYTVCMHI